MLFLITFHSCRDGEREQSLKSKILTTTIVSLEDILVLTKEEVRQLKSKI